ncbi:hypothetical protein JTE90_019727 [Oedothorax gibbosus]|uniref:Translation initiation factor IF-3, mitochondrial n=1 Tax=Oedothorax gibbosus TaxID=931172 RepID=A0AAV6UPC3_9ARAC|nr:hypothetical protein JTE90_019727 [Oedothorax gibbosus]
MFKVIDCCRKLCYVRRNISILSVLRNEESIKKPKRKVSETVELVTLVDQNDKILGLKPKPETEKLARKLNLSLQRVTDPKYGKMHAAYKLMSSSEIMSHEKKKTNAKTLKKLPINNRITDHDLKTKTQTIRKWLERNCEVHVAIAGKNESDSLTKAVFQRIQEDLKDECRIIDVRNKEDALKFIVIPPKKPSAPKTVTKNEDMQDKEINDNP